VLEAIQLALANVFALPHIRLYLGLGWAAYLVGLGTWIILQKREPVATLSWLLGLAALPYVGFFVYLLFGPQRIKRQRLRRSRARVALIKQAHAQSDDEAAELRRLGQALTGFAPSTAREARLLVDGGATYEALIADIAQARHHVHLEYYIYAPDRSGIALRDALVERARAGVRVRLLLDALGSSKATRRFFAPLLAAGGELAWFHPTRFSNMWKFWRRPWVNLRSHRKIVVIDNTIAYTGGINITDEENDRLRPDAYRDLHVRLVGDIVMELQQVFVEDWAYATGQRDFISDVARDLPVPSVGSVRAQVVTSGPDSDWEAIHRMFVSAIHSARHRVWLVTPYFVPGEAALMALTSAALAGIDVRVIVPRMSDSRFVTLAARSYFDALMHSGAKVYEYGPRMLHTKALLVDDDVALLGSANFDARSFRLNFEVSVLFEDTTFAASLARQIEAEFPHAPRARSPRPRSLFATRLPEAFARLLSPLL